jgi:hypothetical protein
MSGRAVIRDDGEIGFCDGFCEVGAKAAPGAVAAFGDGNMHVICRLPDLRSGRKGECRVDR